jgi:cell division protein FtsW (lipid II flippase)
MSKIPRKFLNNVLGWASAICATGTGLAVALLPRDMGQLSARALVLAAVILGALSRSKATASSMDSAKSTSLVDALSIATLLSALGLMYVVFFAPPEVSYRRILPIALSASTLLLAIVANLAGKRAGLKDSI